MPEPNRFLHTGLGEEEALVRQEVSFDGTGYSSAGRSIYVLEPAPAPPPRTASRTGITHHEQRRLSALAVPLRKVRHPIYLAVLAAHALSEKQTRELSRKLKNHIVLYQGRAGIRRRYWLEVLEAERTVHSNIFFPLPENAARFLDTMRGSAVYGQHLDIQPVYDLDGAIGYVSKERTPQAQFATHGRLGARLRGSHPLGLGGGDRIRASKDLQKAAARLCEPHRRTYAKIPADTTAPAATEPPWTADGLFGPLPVCVVPGPPRQAICRARPKLVNDAQRSLDFDTRPDAIDIMRGLGRTHQDIAATVGLSRQQTTNIINRQFGASRRVVRRVLALAMAA